MKSFVTLASVTTALVSFASIEAKALPVNSYMLASSGYSQNIASMQTVLNELGYYRSVITGTMNEETRMAVRAFQSQQGLSASGVVDVDTANKLNSVYSGSFGVASAPFSAPNQLATSVGFSENVFSIQQILQQLGYYNYEIDGIAGQEFRAAVSQFQSSNGLPQTGMVDAQTAQLMNMQFSAAYNISKSQQYGQVARSANEPYHLPESFWSPTNTIWVAAGTAAVVGGVIAASSSGSNSGSQEITFNIAPNDSGNEAYDGVSDKTAFDNPDTTSIPATFLTSETDGNEGIENLNAHFAWARGYDGRVYNRNSAGLLKNDIFDDYIIVGVVDSGVDSDHPDLIDNLLLDHGVTCTATGCVAGSEDVEGHGTEVTGVIAAARNGFGTSGIAPNAKILPLKNDLSTEGAILNYAYANKKGVDVYNNSYGYSVSIVTPTTVGGMEAIITEGDLEISLRPL